MENRRAVIWSVGAAVIAMFAFFLFTKKAVDREIGNLKIKGMVITAKVDIPANTRIDESMFILKEIPEVFIHEKAARLPGEVIGQVALATIAAGEMILTNKVVPFDESSIDRRIPEGYRAATIGIRDDQDVIGVAGLLRPGHFVDILVTLFVNTKEIEKGGSLAALENNGNLKAEVRTAFQNVKILAVGRDARLQTANVNRTFNTEEDLANKNITVALKPDEIQKLILAQSVGRITLSLRRFNDTSLSSLDYLDTFKAFGIKLPVVSGPSPAYREIRGGQVFAAPY